jgi:hypothetical protein
VTRVWHETCRGGFAGGRSGNVVILSLPIALLACETIIGIISILTSRNSFAILCDHKSDRGGLAGGRSVNVIVLAFSIALLAREAVVRVGRSDAWGTLAVTHYGAICCHDFSKRAV